MSERCKAIVLKKTKASCLDEGGKCDKAMCSKADGFTASNVNSRNEEEETCHEDQECRRRAKEAIVVAFRHKKCSMYQEDYKCYDAIPKTCNFSGKVNTQKINCVSKCKSVNISVNENCELKDEAHSASPFSNLPISMTTLSIVTLSAVNGSHIVGRETTAFPRVTADDDNAGRLSGHVTDAGRVKGNRLADTGNVFRTPSPVSGEGKSGAGLMRAPVAVTEILIVWTFGHFL
ncbi:uncharacterized protein [Haliotis asinina]|uniref:uncharacterized protein n=1 Tax=Haliotis asinina TaxID=109174 RepID=UPI003531C382